MLEVVYLLGAVLLLIFVIYFCVLLLYTMLLGAPYAPIGSERLGTVLELLDIKKGEKIADLGSGDGRIVIACAKKGAIATGYEIIPPLVVMSRRNIKKAKIKDASILQKSFWRSDFSAFDSVTIYGTSYMLSRLEKKLQRELHPGSRIVSNHFKFPHLKITKSKNDVHLYIIK